MNKSLILIAITFFFTFQSFGFTEDPAVRTYRLPNGLTAKDYLPKTLIIKYKNVQLKGIKTFDTGDKRKPSILKISYQKAFINQNAITQKSFSDQEKINEIGLNRIYEMGYVNDISVESAINEVLKDNAVEYAEPSFIYHTFADPNDPFYVSGTQSYLNQVKAPQAWGIQHNANGVIIAIVDSGSDLDHEDLAGNIYFNLKDPINGIDDDKDGYIDNFKGWDFVGASASKLVEDNNPDIPADSLDHGVHVSGLASAVTNNSLGIASIAQTAKLMIIKAGADDNASAIYRGYDGIVYAADHGAKIISCSWGGAGGGAFGQDVIDYAVNKGCLVVVAAGNSSINEKEYPAAYKGAFAVANVNSTDVKSSSSSYGYHVAIASPGNNIYSTINNNRYGSKSGTSMATPIVSSAAALVMAKNPTLTGVQVGEILRLNTDDIYALSGNSSYIDQLGSGRLNVFKAVSAANTSIPSIRNQKITINDQSLGSHAIGDTLSYYFDLKNILQSTNGVEVVLSSTNTDVKILTTSLNTGAIAGNETKVIGPFKIVVQAAAADNSTILFKIAYANPAISYQDKEYFTSVVNLDYQNITVNKVYSTITSNGRVGFSGEEATNGLGFIYKDFDLLFEAALMIGNSPTKVSNNARGTNGNSDQHFQKLIRVGKVVNSIAAYEGTATLNDALSPSPLGVTIKTRQLAYSVAPDDKYVIVEYEITNNGPATLTNVYAALFTDWDVDDGMKNFVKYDSGLKMGYTFASTPLSPYAAIKLLSSAAAPLFYPLSYQLPNDPLADGSFTIAEKFTTLSSGISATSLGSGTGLDVMYVIGNGPYTIAGKASVKLAFAFIGGDDLSDISNSAIAAQSKYTNVVTGNDPELEADQFGVTQNYPNPVKSETSFAINIPADGKATIELFDLIGRKVETVYDNDLKKGKYTFTINATELNSGIYFYRTSYEGLEKVMKMMVIK
ncbi:MAG: S8 family serine peptidase [Pelobium sp.]